MSVAGIDFGTTNSSVALVTGESKVELASFTFAGSETLSSRSVLYFEQVKAPGGVKRTHGLSGPAAIERYLDSDEKGRLIQSLKSHLTSRTLTGTEVFGRRHRLEELISRILSDLRKHAEKQFERPIRYAVVGRGRSAGLHTSDRRLFAAQSRRNADVDDQCSGRRLLLVSQADS